MSVASQGACTDGDTVAAPMFFTFSDENEEAAPASKFGPELDAFGPSLWHVFTKQHGVLAKDTF